ncbi:MAG: glycosyltransferase family 2 protein [Pseudorhodoplanes sp.]|nr:glycosyltransferase family 2 protein [Pseudorhodoplanes sp.]
MSDEIQSPAVSVVVPCYNGGRFLDRLVETLKHQTFRDFETIIVDDGSTDPQTVSRLASLPADIRVIRQANGGLSNARNTGFRAAQAEYVLPLDCDDSLEPQFLAETIATMRTAPADVGFVFTDERLAGARSGLAEHHFNAFDQLFVNRLTYCMLLRKSAWRAVGGYDERMRDGYEDWEFNIALAKAGFRGIGIRKPLTVYWVSSEGMLMSKSSTLHARLWSDIRRKHSDLYRLPGVLRQWWKWRSVPHDVTLGLALALLTVAFVLPEQWFSGLVHYVRSRRLASEAVAGR